MDFISLSPVDYIFTGAGSQPITFAFYYPAKQGQDKLKFSLNETLKHFSVLQSQLKRISDHEYVFDISGNEVIFKIKNSDYEFDKKDDIKKYITPVSSFEGEPLTRITLTHTPSGSVLGVSISHALVDGFSYFHFLSSWARISKGERFIPPHIIRNLFSGFFEKIDKKITLQDLLNNCGLFYGEKRKDIKISVNDKFFISSETIKSISEDARQKNNFLLTENDIITGILWKKYLSEWTKNNLNPVTYLTFPFDFRRALPGFPKNYFGCAVCFGTSELNLDELSSLSVTEIAVQVKNSVGKIKRDYIKNSLNTLMNFRIQTDVKEFERIQLRHPANGIIVTNISRMP